SPHGDPLLGPLLSRLIGPRVRRLSANLARVPTASMTDHPGSARRLALESMRVGLAWLNVPAWTATATTLWMAGTVAIFLVRLRRVGAALIDGNRLARVTSQGGQRRR